MKIMPFKNSYNSYAFSAKYKTADVLGLTTNYPYYKPQRKDALSEQQLAKELTGLDFEIDVFDKYIKDEKDSLYLAAYIAFISLCCDKIYRQYPELEQITDTFDPYQYGKEGTMRKNCWFDEQIKKLGSTIDIEPFQLTKEEIVSEYHKFFDIFSKIKF